jgi:hypothetical protein
MGDAKQTIGQIETYIREGGGEYEDWFVGVTDNPINPITEATLLHKVQGRRFMYIETLSPQIAKAVAEHFINFQGTEGDFNERQTNNNCRAVYIYKRAAHLVCYQNQRCDQLTC